MSNDQCHKCHKCQRPNAQCQMANAQCPMPNVKCQKCQRPNGKWPTGECLGRGLPFGVRRALAAFTRRGATTRTANHPPLSFRPTADTSLRHTQNSNSKTAKATASLRDITKRRELAALQIIRPTNPPAATIPRPGEAKEAPLRHSPKPCRRQGTVPDPVSLPNQRRSRNWEKWTVPVLLPL